MSSAVKRFAAATGATALMAVVAIGAAPSAQADGDYYATWTLAAIKAEGQKVTCKGTSQEPEDCPGGETLSLRSNYRYRASAYLAQILWLGAKGNGKGSFATSVFASSGAQVLVLEGDSGGILPLGSAWQMVLKDEHSGSPTKMVLTLQTGFGEYSLVLRRDAK